MFTYLRRGFGIAELLFLFWSVVLMAQSQAFPSATTEPGSTIALSTGFLLGTTFLIMLWVFGTVTHSALVIYYNDPQRILAFIVPSIFLALTWPFWWMLATNASHLHWEVLTPFQTLYGLLLLGILVVQVLDLILPAFKKKRPVAKGKLILRSEWGKRAI